MYDLNFYMWILLRVLLQTLAIIVGLYLEFTVGQMSTVTCVTVVAFTGFIFYFSINWAMMMVRNRRKMARNSGS